MMNFKQLTICMLSSLVLMACSKPITIEPSIMRVSVFELPEVEHSNLRSFKGVAKAHDLVELSFRVDGRIAKIPVTKGQLIKKGDVLAQLDQTDYQVALNDRKAKQVLTAKQHKRAKTLLDKKLMSQAEYDKIRADFLVAKAQLKMAELELQYTTLKAPFDGIVGDMFLDSFENVLPGISVLSAHKIDLIEVNVEVPDIILAVTTNANDEAARQKRRFDVVFEAYPEITFTGTPLELNTQKDPATRTYIATLTVPIDPNYKLLEGMPVTVSVDLSGVSHRYKNEYLLPVNAVVLPDGGNLAKQEAFVWLYNSENQTVSSQAVQIDALIGDMIEVTGGLEGGELIISNGASRLTEGQKVEIKEG
jgi:RND family efflux transporter MFP subunit